MWLQNLKPTDTAAHRFLEDALQEILETSISTLKQLKIFVSQFDNNPGYESFKRIGANNFMSSLQNETVETEKEYSQFFKR